MKTSEFLIGRKSGQEMARINAAGDVFINWGEVEGVAKAWKPCSGNPMNGIAKILLAARDAGATPPASAPAPAVPTTIDRAWIIKAAEDVGLIGPRSRVGDSHNALDRLADVIVSAAPAQEPVKDSGVVEDAERFRWAIDPKHSEQVGVCSYEDEFRWLFGDEARAAIDALREKDAPK